MMLNEVMVSKWIQFVHDGSSESGKTSVWTVITNEGYTPLGQIKWFARWRKYAFFPHTNTVFEEDCLRDISFFCEQATRQHRQK